MTSNNDSPRHRAPLQDNMWYFSRQTLTTRSRSNRDVVLSTPLQPSWSAKKSSATSSPTLTVSTSESTPLTSHRSIADTFAMPAPVDDSMKQLYKDHHSLSSPTCTNVVDDEPLDFLETSCTSSMSTSSGSPESTPCSKASPSRHRCPPPSGRTLFAFADDEDYAEEDEVTSDDSPPLPQSRHRIDSYFSPPRHHKDASYYRAPPDECSVPLPPPTPPQPSQNIMRSSRLRRNSQRRSFFAPMKDSSTSSASQPGLSERRRRSSSLLSVNASGSGYISPSTRGSDGSAGIGSSSDELASPVASPSRSSHRKHARRISRSRRSFTSSPRYANNISGTNGSNGSGSSGGGSIHHWDGEDDSSQRWYKWIVRSYRTKGLLMWVLIVVAVCAVSMTIVTKQIIAQRVNMNRRPMDELGTLMFLQPAAGLRGQLVHEMARIPGPSTAVRYSDRRLTVPGVVIKKNHVMPKRKKFQGTTIDALQYKASRHKGAADEVDEKLSKSTHSFGLVPVSLPKKKVVHPRFEAQDRNFYLQPKRHRVEKDLAERRTVVLHDSILQSAKSRKIQLYPSDFTDNTQLYGILDSNDERMKTMELREPLVQGECVPMKEWQTTFHPTCNGMHEVDISHAGEKNGEGFNLFGTKGYWRHAWRLDLLNGKNHSDERDTVVLKTLKIEHRFEEAHYEHDRIDAVAMERLTSSPHVINVFGFCGHSVMTEYADGKRLGELADKSRKVPLSRLRIAHDIASGLADVHGIDGDGNATFVHLDINPANVVSVGGTLKLNDFNIGIIRRWNTTSNKPCGFPAQYPNPQWRSPEEARNEQNLTEKVDVFSMGHIFFRLICGHEPWHKLEPGGKPSKAEMNEKVKNGVLPYIPQDVKESTDPEVIAIRDAMLRCYTYDPNQRPSAREIANSLKQALDWLTESQKI